MIYEGFFVACAEPSSVERKSAIPATNIDPGGSRGVTPVMMRVRSAPEAPDVDLGAVVHDRGDEEPETDHAEPLQNHFLRRSGCLACACCRGRPCAEGYRRFALRVRSPRWKSLSPALG